MEALLIEPDGFPFSFNLTVCCAQIICYVSLSFITSIYISSYLAILTSTWKLLSLRCFVKGNVYSKKLG